MAPRTRPTRLRNLSMGLVVCGVFFTLSEGLLRVALGSPPPPVRVARIFTEKDHYFERNGDWIQSTYQAPPVPPFKAVSSAPRGAVLGASSVHGGGGVDPADSNLWRSEFPALLGEATGLPTLNLGTAGASSRDLLAVLEQVASYSIDVLVLYTGHCDVGNAYFERRFRGFDGLTIRSHPWLERSQLFVQYRDLLTPIRRRLRGDDSSANGSSLVEEEVRLIRREFKINLRRIASICRRSDIRLVMMTPVCDLTYPPVYGSGSKGQMTYDLWRQGMELRSSDPHEAARLLERARDRSMRPTRVLSSVEAVVAEVAAEEQATLVDARRLLPMDSSGSVPAPWLFIDELHFSDRGHAAMAELLSPVVRSLAQRPAGDTFSVQTSSSERPPSSSVVSLDTFAEIEDTVPP